MHVLLHPAITFSLYLLHLLPSFQLPSTSKSCQFSPSFLLLLSFLDTFLHLQLPEALSASKATKGTTHYTALLPLSCFTAVAVGKKLGSRQTGGKLCASKARGMPAFDKVFMVRQVTGRRRKHSMVQSFAVQQFMQWALCSAQEVAVMCNATQCWPWQRQGREMESTTADNGGLAECWKWMNECCPGVLL